MIWDHKSAFHLYGKTRLFQEITRVRSFVRTPRDADRMRLSGPCKVVYGTAEESVNVTRSIDRFNLKADGCAGVSERYLEGTNERR